MQETQNEIEAKPHKNSANQKVGVLFPFVILLALLYLVYQTHGKLQQTLANIDLSEKHALWASLAGYVLLFLSWYFVFKFLKTAKGKKTIIFVKNIVYLIVFTAIAYHALVWAVPNITPLHTYIFTAFFALLIASSVLGRKAGGALVLLMFIDGLFSIEVFSSLINLLP